jgi:putative membrane protein insertion efficiency factor
MQHVLIALVKAYRLLLSPWVGSACRFEPTCSAYSLEALQTHGAARGSYLTLRRLVRCHPWCAGGHDPVPQADQQFLSKLTSSNIGKKTS